MRLLASRIAEALDGRLHPSDAAADSYVDGASFDSRTTALGELFVPIVAERDGHDFVSAAIDAGATAFLTDRPPVDHRVPSVEVADTSDALLRLGAWARGRLDVPVVGITGSVGKTSTKDFVAAALAATRTVTASARSFNNEQGLPVTILGADDDTDVLVVEMGMRGFGQITRLCDIARPTIGVVTAVAESHTELVGDIDGVARAKGELVEALPADGVAVLNGDDDRVAAMASRAAGDVVTYGIGGGAGRTLAVTDVHLDQLARARFTAHSPWGSADVRLPVSGLHMVANAAAALAVAGVVEGRIDAAAAALADATVSAMRMDVRRTSGGAVLVNDAYNANPTSMAAALEAVAAMDAVRRVAVLGLMAELADPLDAHRRIAAQVEALGIELIPVGTDLYGLDPVTDPVAAVGGIADGTVVLVKASRAAGLDRVADEILAR